jgi:hypothetical protein
MKMARVLVMLAAVAACKGKPTGHGAPPEVIGPAVRPVVTSSVTFLVPKSATWWGEMAFPCYVAAIKLQPNGSVAAPFTKLSPTVEPALRAADIDIEHDIAAIGAYGAGGLTFYIALEMRHPERLHDLLAALVPGQSIRQVSPTHDVVAMPGGREIHVQLYPIAWTAKPTGDAWSTAAAKATHVLFVTGLSGRRAGEAGKATADPLTNLADMIDAAARVKDVEGVLADAHGRCVAGFVGATDFQPGYSLEHARFGVAAPEGKGDPFTNLLGSRRTLELALELTLAPAPTEHTISSWIAQAKESLRDTFAPIKTQFQGPLVDVVFDLAGLLGDKGFRSTLNDKTLTMTWRTDRIGAADLATYESRLEAVMPNSTR